MPIEPHIPPGPGGSGGGPGGCTPGNQVGPSSIAISPGFSSSDNIFVPIGTQVQLTGHATVRRVNVDCSVFDHRCSSIWWNLSYQPPGGESTNVTSILDQGPQTNPNSFVTGLPGAYQIELGCYELGSIVAVKKVFAGSSLKLNCTAAIWVSNEFLGSSKDSGVGVNAILVETPSSQQVTIQVSPIIDSGSNRNIEITQRSADGTFDSANGVLSLHFVGDFSGQVSGNQASGSIDITLSTEGSITPPNESSPINGKRRGGDGSIVLVGDAPLVGPTGTTHCWLQLSGTLTNE